MLASLIVKFQEKGERDVDRYEAWTASLLRLREAFKQGENIGIVKLRDFLQYISEDQRSGTLQDLIAEHLKLTWQEKPGKLLEAYFEEYGEKFEELNSPATVPVDLVEDEFLARYQQAHGDFPSVKEYQQRFPGRNDIIEHLEQRCLDSGRYVKLNIIGRGAMGDVWKAYDCRSKNLIAIKQTETNSNHLGLAEESGITSELDHPSIVTLQTLQQEDSSAPPLYGMTLVDGRSLAQEIGKYHTPSEQLSKADRRKLMRQLLQILVDVCESLEYAHSKGILHCDLKPGNILLNEDDNPAIIDWGMAKVITNSAPSPVSHHTVIAGTPEYMPPEQADGFADTRSEVFGLGAILYQILTGSPPHKWDNRVPPPDWAHRVRQSQIEQASETTRSTPAALNAICNKALTQNPEMRYQTASALAQDIKNFLNGRAVSVWTEAIPARIWRKLRRR